MRRQHKESRRVIEQPPAWREQRNRKVQVFSTAPSRTARRKTALAEDDVPLADSGDAGAAEFFRRSSHVLSRRVLDWDGVSAEVVERERTEAAEFHVCLPRHALYYQRDTVPAFELRLAGGPLRRFGTRPGSATFMPAGADYWGVERRTPRRSFLAVFLEPRLIEAAAEEAGGRGGPLRPVPDLDVKTPMLWHALELLRHECDHGNPSGRLGAEGLAVVLATHLARSHFGADPVAGRPAKGGLRAGRLRRVLDHIEAHAAEEIGLHRLAELAGLSRSHFARAFKQSVGVPPHEYLVRRRVERAKTLLRDRRRLTIAEVAQVAGFCDHSHLTNHFRRLTGATPSAYRDQA
jgi:AraC family transcriptional regulator